MPGQARGKIIKSLDEVHNSQNSCSKLNFSLSQILQTTLDVYDMVRRFQQALFGLVPHHSFHYHHLQTQHGLDIGNRAPFQAHYELMLQGAQLGEIYFTRQTDFTEQELNLIENSLSELVYPLRNAIQYHEAIKNSYTCALTQVGNRAAYDKAIHREIDFAKRHATPFSLVLVDVDRFKTINDNHGHHAGDDVLQTLAKVINQLNRNTDNLFRYGGEEFALLLSHSPLEGANYVATRLRQHVELSVFEYQGIRLPITISAGVTAFTLDDTAEKIFKRADKALYIAKQSGRNCVVSK